VRDSSASSGVAPYNGRRWKKGVIEGKMRSSLKKVAILKTFMTEVQEGAMKEGGGGWGLGACN